MDEIALIKNYSKEVGLSTKVLGDKVLSVLKKHSLPIVVLFVLAFIFLGRVGQMRPFDADNLVALSFGNLDLSGLVTGSFTSYLPAYRPLSKLAVYLQYYLGGINHLQSFFWANWLIWSGCAIGLYILIEKITRSRWASLIGAIGLLLDPRAIYALVWIGERQNTICLLTGIAALYIAFNSERIDYKKLILINTLLLLSLLSKEFGLAFLIPVFLVLLGKTKNYKIAFSVFISIGIYIFARLTLGTGSNNSGSFCETMGYFRQTSEICFSQMNLIAKVKQYLYNSGASFIGTFIPFLFSRAGTLNNIKFTTGFALSFIFTSVLFVPILLAVAKRFKESIVFLVLIVLAAFTNFMLFRERNLLIGIFGFYALLGVGLSLIFQKIKNRYFFLGIAGLAIVAIIYFNGLSFKEELNDFVTISGKNDPCRALQNYPHDIDKTTVQTVSSYYNLNLNCQNK